MDVPANGWASRSNGWMFLTNGWVSRSNGWTFLSNGWASRSNGWMLLPNGWASHSNGWTFLSNGWSSRSNGCKFFWTDDPGRSNECKFLSNGFQTGSKRNSVRKRKAVIARFRVKGHIFLFYICSVANIVYRDMKYGLRSTFNQSQHVQKPTRVTLASKTFIAHIHCSFK